MGGGSFPHLGSNNTSGEWPQNAFYAHPDGGSMGYGMEFALGMNGSGGGAAADGGSGGVGYAGPWGSADPSMNLETLWPQNASGLFDSMLMPGYANSMEMVSPFRFLSFFRRVEDLKLTLPLRFFLCCRSARRSCNVRKWGFRCDYAFLPVVVSLSLPSVAQERFPRPG